MQSGFFYYKSFFNITSSDQGDRTRKGVRLS
jgi:hypothetical protein